MKYTILAILVFLLPSLVLADQQTQNDNDGGSHDPSYPQPFHKNQLKALVTFGDSYTDTTFISNGGTIQWPQYVALYAGIDLYPFAKAGATCSNNMTFRPFPPVFESQIPTFLDEKNNHTIKLDQKNTLYSLWIGTNDIGVSSLLTGDNDASIVDVAQCMVDWVKTMYKNGARNFLFQNVSGFISSSIG